MINHDIVHREAHALLPERSTALSGTHAAVRMLMASLLLLHNAQTDVNCTIKEEMIRNVLCLLRCVQRVS